MWPNSQETQELLAHVQQGEPGALDRLLAHCREPLRRMIGLRLDAALARRLDASDVVQDVMLEVSRRLPDYLKNPAMPFHLWLRSIAQDHIIDAHRRHRQAQRRSIDREQPIFSGLADQSSVELVDALIDRELTPATAAIRQELGRRFQSALAELDQDDREMILMRHFEQLSNQEVAASLNLTEAAASMRYLRALRKLRKIMMPG
ncbi:MAG: sigma-70 family RNA polymerase sigma factor [Planctomycetes bacterium]|nr:sigma-70 family RNA polymerase sigma factor [Planctomycetota bacterium]